MTTYGTYTFDAEDDTDCQAFLWNSSQGQTVADTLDPAGTVAKFCHDTNGGNSSNVGPDSGQGGSPDGYAYSECSSPGANGDTYTMEFDTTLDASAEQWQFNFYTCQRGPAIGNNQSTCDVQINESGGGWSTVTGGDLGGAGDDTTTSTWVSRSIDMSESGANTDASTRIRLLITTQGPTNAWHADYGIDTVTIVGTPLATYELGGTTYDKNGSALGSVECYLFKDNGDNTLTYLDYELSNVSTGVYLFTGIADNDSAYLVVAWKDDTPHVFDVTDHNLTPTLT